jgi:DNA-binding response OmpR family regulator
MTKLKVLLAEDDMTMVSLLTTLLKMEGFDVVALRSDADVPAAVRAENPDVLLLDVHLSQQNGFDILDSIRKSEDTAGMRVVMSSGSNVKDECMNHGANGFLMKPYMPDELITILKQTIKSA